MFPCFGFVYGLWWLLPLIMMVVMIALCFFVTRRFHRMGCCMKGQYHFRDEDSKSPDPDLHKNEHGEAKILKPFH
jgi:uncharacterized membrane protein